MLTNTVLQKYGTKVQYLGQN